MTVEAPRLLRFPHEVMPFVEEGICLFQAGRFWESHEAWESAWRLLPRSQQKILIQVLIQIAASCVLFQDGRRSGSQRKRGQALHKLEGLYEVGIRRIAPFPIEALCPLLKTPTFSPEVLQSYFKQVMSDV
ncbi:MAG: DUF309 domain-containing protein [Vampirovibrio sp.]